MPESANKIYLLEIIGRILLENSFNIQLTHGKYKSWAVILIIMIHTRINTFNDAPTCLVH